MAHRVLQGPHLLGWGPAKAGLARPVAGSRLAGFLYDANEAVAGGEGRLRLCPALVLAGGSSEETGASSDPSGPD